MKKKKIALPRKKPSKKTVSASHILSEGGLLSEVVSGFRARGTQQEMAKAITDAIQEKSLLMVEAGTGTGKTFAYLVPVFLSGKKTIISTGTKHLQDQLFFTDIPIIKKCFPDARNVMLLKGRANYLCKHRIEQSRMDGRFLSRQQASQLHTVDSFSRTTKTGDIAEITVIPEDAAIWPHVTSTGDNCLNQDCSFYKDCFLMKARQQAKLADILVVNHHLFFADMALQEEGLNELLPGAEAVIFDEAHHISDIASQFFSVQCSGRQLMDLTRDTEMEAVKEAPDMKSILDQSSALQKAVQETRQAFGSDLRRALWVKGVNAIEGAIESLKYQLGQLQEVLKEAAVRGKGLESCWKRAAELYSTLASLMGESPDNSVRWFETHLHSFTLQRSPIIIADQFMEYLKKTDRTWIFTSATLTVKNDFSLFRDALGLCDARALQLGSPFDYQNQALLYVPRGLPDPRAAHYTESLLEAMIPVLEASGGKAFVLCTSYKSLDYLAEKLEGRVSYPLLVQGSRPKHELIAEFKKQGCAILVGTSSFWYGVDVQGEALSCVVIDKLPFVSPDDPLLQARLQWFRKKGLDPFQVYQLPNAVLMLKQGAGRLIRGMNDRGVLMICDPRLVASSYGETFLRSLPDMPRTREIDKVRAFYA